MYIYIYIYMYILLAPPRDHPQKPPRASRPEADEESRSDKCFLKSPTPTYAFTLPFIRKESLV